MLDDTEHPLPPPKQHADELRRTALVAIHNWHREFGPRHKQIGLAHRFLAERKRVDFSAIHARAQIEASEAAAKVERRRSRKNRTFVAVRERFADLRSEIDATVLQMRSCFELLIPRDGVFTTTPAGSTAEISACEESTADGQPRAALAAAAATITTSADDDNNDGWQSDDSWFDLEEYTAARPVVPEPSTEVAVPIQVTVTAHTAGAEVHVSESADNRDIITLLQDCARLIARRLEPRLTGWISTLVASGATGAADLAAAMLTERERLRTVLRDAQRTGIPLFVGRRAATAAAGPDSDCDADDDDLVDVESDGGGGGGGAAAVAAAAADDGVARCGKVLSGNQKVGSNLVDTKRKINSARARLLRTLKRRRLQPPSR